MGFTAYGEVKNMARISVLVNDKTSKVVVKRDKLTNKKYIVKSLYKIHIDDEDLIEFDGSMIPHEINNINTLSGLTGFAKVVTIFNLPKKYVVITHFLEGYETLFEYSKSKLTEMKCKTIINRIIELKEVMDTKAIFHGDLKSDNIMINEAGNIVIIDFGSSKPMSEAYKDLLHNDLWGTPEYVKNGNVLHDPYYVWVITLLAYEMVVGNYAFDSIKEIEDETLPNIPFNVSAKFTDFIRRGLEKEVENRMKFVDIKQSPWLSRKNATHRLKNAKSKAKYNLAFKSENLPPNGIKIDEEVSAILIPVSS